MQSGFDFGIFIHVHRVFYMIILLTTSPFPSTLSLWVSSSSQELTLLFSRLIYTSFEYLGFFCMRDKMQHLSS